MDLFIIPVLSVRELRHREVKKLVGGLKAAKWQARMQTQEVWPQSMRWEALCCEFNIYLLNKQMLNE